MNREVGQATVEYILMLLVIASIAMGVYDRVKKMAKDDESSFFLTPFALLESEEPEQRYKKFRIIR